MQVAAVAAGVQGSSALPMFLVGGLAVQMRAELGFGPAALGAATSAFVLARALSSLPFGRLVDRLGAIRAMRLAALGTAASLLGVAAFAQNWLTLAAPLAFGGAMQALIQPAANRFVARGVSANRLGAAFGLKQSGPPVATLFAGLAVPTIALTVGWRWAYVCAAVMCVVAVAFTIGWERVEAGHPARQAPRSAEGAGLWWLAAGFAFTLATVNALNTFLVESAVASGIDPGHAGFLLAAGSLLAIVARLAYGVQADRRGQGHLRVVARGLAVGAIGFVLLSVGQPATVGAGAAVVYATAWGVNGLFFMAVVRANPSSPGAATGTVVAGGSLGGLLGPPLFGLVADRFGFGAAWLLTTCWVLLAALAVTQGRTELHRRRAAAEAAR